MRKKAARSAAVVLAAAMVVGTLAGCGAKDQGSEATSNRTEDGTGFKDYSEGFPEEVTIQIPVYDRAYEGWDPTDNYYTNWVQTEFGDKYNINVEYVAIGRTTEVQDYMQMIAAQTAPDIIMSYDMPQAVNYYNEDAMQPLDLEEIEYYAPTYYANMKDTVAQYGSLNGENMFFFAERNPVYYSEITLIRQDWLDEVGMDMPTNEAELEEVGRAWKEAGLGTLGNSLITQSFTYEYPYFDDSISEEEYGKYLDLTVAPLTWEPSEKYLKNLNEEYNEGIVDQEFYLNAQDTDWKADFVSGRCGTYKFRIGNTTDVFDSLLANNPDAEVSTLDPGALSPEGKGYYYAYPPYGMVMGISATTPAEERAAVWMYLEWLSQPENLFKMQNGVEGDNYTLDEDGIAVPIAGFEGESKLSQNNNKDYWCLVVEDVTYGDAEKDYKANLRLLAPAGYEYLIEQAYNYYQEDAEYGIVTPVFTKVIESISEYSSDLNAMWQEFYVDLATCDPSEFDAKYEEYCQEYLEGGYQDILDEKQEAMEEGSYIIAE